MGDQEQPARETPQGTPPARCAPRCPGSSSARPGGGCRVPRGWRGPGRSSSASPRKTPCRASSKSPVEKPSPVSTRCIASSRAWYPLASSFSCSAWCFHRSVSASGDSGDRAPRRSSRAAHLGHEGGAARERLLRFLPERQPGALRETARRTAARRRRVSPFPAPPSPSRPRLARHDAHERGLAAAVRSDEGHARTGGNREVHRVEEDPLPEGDGYSREADKGHRGGSTATG